MSICIYLHVHVEAAGLGRYAYISMFHVEAAGLGRKQARPIRRPIYGRRGEAQAAEWPRLGGARGAPEASSSGAERSLLGAVLGGGRAFGGSALLPTYLSPHGAWRHAVLSSTPTPTPTPTPTGYPYPHPYPYNQARLSLLVHLSEEAEGVVQVERHRVRHARVLVGVLERRVVAGLAW